MRDYKNTKPTHDLYEQKGSFFWDFMLALLIVGLTGLVVVSCDSLVNSSTPCFNGADHPEYCEKG